MSGTMKGAPLAAMSALARATVAGSKTNSGEMIEVSSPGTCEDALSMLATTDIAYTGHIFALAAVRAFAASAQSCLLHSIPFSGLLLWRQWAVQTCSGCTGPDTPRQWTVQTCIGGACGVIATGVCALLLAASRTLASRIPNVCTGAGGSWCSHGS